MLRKEKKLIHRNGAVKAVPFFDPSKISTYSGIVDYGRRGAGVNRRLAWEFLRRNYYYQLSSDPDGSNWDDPDYGVKWDELDLTGNSAGAMHWGLVMAKPWNKSWDVVALDSAAEWHIGPSGVADVENSLKKPIATSDDFIGPPDLRRRTPVMHAIKARRKLPPWAMRSVGGTTSISFQFEIDDLALGSAIVENQIEWVRKYLLTRMKAITSAAQDRIPQSNSWLKLLWLADLEQANWQVTNSEVCEGWNDHEEWAKVGVKPPKEKDGGDLSFLEEADVAKKKDAAHFMIYRRGYLQCLLPDKRRLGRADAAR